MNKAYLLYVLALATSGSLVAEDAATGDAAPSILVELAMAADGANRQMRVVVSDGETARIETGSVDSDTPGHEIELTPELLDDGRIMLTLGIRGGEVSESAQESSFRVIVADGDPASVRMGDVGEDIARTEIDLEASVISAEEYSRLISGKG